jgi:hypothetical protein
MATPDPNPQVPPDSEADNHAVENQTADLVTGVIYNDMPGDDLSTSKDPRVTDRSEAEDLPTDAIMGIQYPDMPIGGREN